MTTRTCEPPNWDFDIKLKLQTDIFLQFFFFYRLEC